MAPQQGAFQRKPARKLRCFYRIMNGQSGGMGYVCGLIPEPLKIAKAQAQAVGLGARGRARNLQMWPIATAECSCVEVHSEKPCICMLGGVLVSNNPQASSVQSSPSTLGSRDAGSRQRASQSQLSGDINLGSGTARLGLWAAAELKP